MNLASSLHAYMLFLKLLKLNFSGDSLVKNLPIK